MNPQLTTRLRHLRLSGMVEALPLRLEQAKAAPLEHLEFLDLLVQDELARRADRLFVRRLKQAGITQVKELSSFDWAFNPKIPRANIADLATARFMRAHHGALLMGPPGVGKSHVAVAIAVGAIRAGYHAFVRSAFDLAQDFAEAEAEGQRRDFVQVGKGWEEHKEWALGWLRRIRAIYRCNRQRLAVLDKPAEWAVTDAALRAAVQAMRVQMESELADPHLRPPCRRALESLQNHWIGLTLFVDDPRIPLDNNASERCARGPAVGRKNYYGSGSFWGGRLAAMLFSLFATLRMGKLNSRKWLAWYLQSCAANGGKAPKDVQPFLPWNLSPEKRQELSLEHPVTVVDSS